MDEGMDGTAIETETETGKGKGNSVRPAGRIPTETDTKTCLQVLGQTETSSRLQPLRLLLELQLREHLHLCLPRLPQTLLPKSQYLILPGRTCHL